VFFSNVALLPGVYLPLLWDQSFCWKSPLTLGYTRGHFSALVPRVPFVDYGGSLAAPASCNADVGAVNLSLRRGRLSRPGGSVPGIVNYVPLVSGDGKLLPVHYLTHSEVRIKRYLWIKVNLVGVPTFGDG
jgi:ubiquitin thioesterase ZRANB1